MVFFEKSSVSSPADLEYLVNCYNKTVAGEVMLRATGGSGHVLLEALRVGGKHIFDLAACAGAVEQRAALTKLFNLFQKGLGSSTGQRVIQTLVLAWLGWASVHYGFVLPAASAPAAAPAPIP